ncbi:MAG: c-type cytochrome [Candidatus Hydrogenedens sp.]|nr:c-type cytochrome [Candidatus Hydrogenedens sp.]
MAMRLPVEGTVAYRDARRPWVSTAFETISGGGATAPAATDTAFYTGKQDGQEMATNYFPVSMELLQRGRERFEITCTPCHGYTGEGDGIIVGRGFPQPTTYHIDRLREANDGYFFDVMTNGFGRMYSYAARVAPEDRWAIVAYIRALQHSQNVDLSDPSTEMAQLFDAGLAEQEAAAAAAAASEHHGEGHGDAHGGHGESHDTEHGGSQDGGEAAAAGDAATHAEQH